MFKLEHVTLGFLIQQYAKGWAISVDADAGCFDLELIGNNYKAK